MCSVSVHAYQFVTFSNSTKANIFIFDVCKYFVLEKNSNKLFSIYDSLRDNIICFLRFQVKNLWLLYSSVEWNMVYLFEWHNDPNYLNYYLILSGDCRNLNKMNSEMNQVQIWITFKWPRWGWMEILFLLFIDTNLEFVDKN